MTLPDPAADAVLLHFDDEAGFAHKLAAATGLRAAAIARHRFPDGELKLTLPPQLPSTVVLLRSLTPPNDRLIELMITAGAARTSGARRLVLVAPYLAYMRQDMAFAPGEAVSQRIVGAWLGATCDAVITVDPHLHRIARLEEAVPARAAVALQAAPAIGAFLARQAAGARWMLLGPDEESAPNVSAAAAAAGFDWGVCRKTRHGDRDVQVVLPERSLAGRHVVLVDDVASTGHTMMQAARAVRAAGAVAVDVAVTHALFVGDALAQLAAAGVGGVWSCDTVPHATNAVSVVELIAESLRGLR